MYDKHEVLKVICIYELDYDKDQTSKFTTIFLCFLFCWDFTISL